MTPPPWPPPCPQSHFGVTSKHPLSPLLPSVCLSLRRSLSLSSRTRRARRRATSRYAAVALRVRVTADGGGGRRDKCGSSAPDRPDDRRSLSLYACMTAVLSSRLSFYRRPPKGVHAPRESLRHQVSRFRFITEELISEVSRLVSPPPTARWPCPSRDRSTTAEAASSCRRRP